MKTLVYYETIRAKHVERFLKLNAAQSIGIIYSRISYDRGNKHRLDEVARQVGLRQAILRLMSRDIDIVEMNEPLYLGAFSQVLAVVFCNILRPVFGRRRYTIVSYAIENADVSISISERFGITPSISRFLVSLYLAFISRNINRIAFGTEAARVNYLTFSKLNSPRLELRSFPSLEPVCAHCSKTKKRGTVTFLGALEERKGIREVMMAWPNVGHPCTLHILGKGELEREVVDWARSRDDVLLELDPPRERIHEVLSSACALVLLSQKSKLWREQVGLPILEGLAHGCRIIASSETGLATWLSEHGHNVLDPEAGAHVLANALRTAAMDDTSVGEIQASLPLVDGRAEASAWLWNGVLDE